MKTLVKYLFAALVALSSSAGWAQEAPDALVKRVSEEVLDIIRKDTEVTRAGSKKLIELIEAKIFPHFDFERMTALAVGKDWKQATPEQKKRIIAEFHALLVRTYSNALLSYQDETIRYRPLKMSLEETEVLVKTEILQPGNKPISINYSLEKHENAWMVFDVAVAGVSLVGNYRDTFANEVRARGIDGLLKMLEDKNRQLEQKQAEAAKK